MALQSLIKIIDFVTMFHVEWNGEQDMEVYDRCGEGMKEVYFWNYLFSDWVLYFIDRLDGFIAAVTLSQNFTSDGVNVVPVDVGPFVHPHDVRLAKITFDSMVDAKFEELMITLKGRGASIDKVERIDNDYGMPQVASVVIEEADCSEIQRLAIRGFVKCAKLMNRMMTNMIKEVYHHYRVRVLNKRFVVKAVEERLREYKAWMVNFYHDVMLERLTVK